MKNKKLFYALGGILLVALVAGGAIYMGSSEQLQGYLRLAPQPSRMTIRPVANQTRQPSTGQSSGTTTSTDTQPGTSPGTSPAGAQPGTPGASAGTNTGSETHIITLNPNGTNILANSSQAQLMNFKIQNASSKIMELTPANHNTFTFKFIGMDFASTGAGDYCALYSGDGTKLASVNRANDIQFIVGVTAPNDASGVPVSATGATIYPASSADFALRCTVAGAVAGTSLAPSLTKVTWGDGTTSNIDDPSQIQPPLPLIGQSLAN